MAPGLDTFAAVGFLDRVIGAVNKVGTPIDSLTDTVGPSRYRKGRDLEREGRSVAGRIAGIERRLDGGEKSELFALELTGPDGPGPRGHADPDTGDGASSARDARAPARR